MDLMDAPVEDGAMPSPADMGVGLDQEKMAAFDAAVTKRRDAAAALGTKTQAEAKSALAQLETERQERAFRERVQVAMGAKLEAEARAKSAAALKALKEQLDHNERLDAAPTVVPIH